MLKRWDVLGDLIEDHDLRVMAEVGVKSGRTMDMVLFRCPDVTAIAVDPWTATDGYRHWSRKQVRHHEREFNVVMARHPGRIRKIKAYSVEAALSVDDASLDLVFIDGDHRCEAVRDDIAAWRPKVRTGGWMAGHDYHHPRFPGVAEAVDEAFGEIVKADDRVWMIRV